MRRQSTMATAFAIACAVSCGQTTSDQAESDPPSVSCGEDRCSPPTEYCCALYGTTEAGGCRPAFEADNCTGSSSVAMLCDGPEDCPGTLCCGLNGAGLPILGAIQCATVCPMDGGHTLLCQPHGAEVCPKGYACEVSPLLPAYHVCTPI